MSLSEPELTEPVIVSDDSLTTESDIQPGELSGDGKFTWQVIVMLVFSLLLGLLLM